MWYCGCSNQTVWLADDGGCSIIEKSLFGWLWNHIYLFSCPSWCSVQWNCQILRFMCSDMSPWSYLACLKALGSRALSDHPCLFCWVKLFVTVRAFNYAWISFSNRYIVGQCVQRCARCASYVTWHSFFSLTSRTCTVCEFAQ